MPCRFGQHHPTEHRPRRPGPWPRHVASASFRGPVGRTRAISAVPRRASTVDAPQSAIAAAFVARPRRRPPSCTSISQCLPAMCAPPMSHPPARRGRLQQAPAGHGRTGQAHWEGYGLVMILVEVERRCSTHADASEPHLRTSAVRPRPRIAVRSVAPCCPAVRALLFGWPRTDVRPKPCPVVRPTAPS